MKNNNTLDTRQDNINPGLENNAYKATRSWFTFIVFFLLFWIATYLAVHLKEVHSGYVNLKFSSEQIQQINKILYAKDPIHPVETIIPAKTIRDTSSSNGDTTKPNVYQTAEYIAYYDKCDDSCRVNKAMLYIRGEFDNNIKNEQVGVIKEYISSFGAQEVGAFLVNLKLKIKSYFWLTGPFVYIEIIFWSVLGVICSILFTLGNSVRHANAAYFNFHRIPYDIAKIFYAPFCAMIVVLAYNYIKHRNVIEVNTNEGMLVFSFVAGLFAGRMMSTLERVKDLLLPENGSPMQPGYTPIAKPAKQSLEKQAQMEEQEQVELKLPEIEEYTYTAPSVEATLVNEVVIELKLDTNGLFEEERNEILEAGFDTAVVTLHSVNGRDTLRARKTGDKTVPLFLSSNIEAGIYIVRATLTQKLSDDYIINLFGEKTAYITKDNKEVELYIKKYEAID